MRFIILTEVIIALITLISALTISSPDLDPVLLPIIGKRDLSSCSTALGSTCQLFKKKEEKHCGLATILQCTCTHESVAYVSSLNLNDKLANIDGTLEWNKGYV